jgi:hypothetical protein
VRSAKKKQEKGLQNNQKVFSIDLSKTDNRPSNSKSKGFVFFTKKVEIQHVLLQNVSSITLKRTSYQKTGPSNAKN